MSQVAPSARARSIEARAACGVERRALGVLVVGVALGLALDRGWLVCPLATLFSLPCPGCGLTRAAFLLVRGDWHGAVRLHPLAPLLVPLVALTALRAAGRYIQGPRLQGSGPAPRRARFDTRLGARWLDGAARLLAIALIAMWALRFAGAFGGPVPVALLPP